MLVLVMEFDQNRRNFVIGSTALALSTALPLKALATGANVEFYNLHTGENFILKNVADASNLADANKFFRDHRTGDIHEIDPQLLQQIQLLFNKLGKKDSVIEIISGYRSPKTNAKLAAKSSGVAKKSYHMQGRAIDLRITGVDIKKQFEAAKELKLGGVGCYSKSQFIHLDTGPVRSWGG